MSWTVYRHYKGNPYLRLGVGAHSEDLSPHVLYRCLYDNPAARTWLRPQDMFEGALEDGRPRFKPVARIRLVHPEDLPVVLAFGHDAWGQGKPLAEFIAGYEQSRNHLRGTRYLLETPAGVPVAGLNTLNFRRGVMGLASVATAPAHRGKGYSALLVRGVMELQRFLHGDLRFLLFSEVPPSVYERHGFRVLPAEHQRFLPSVAMATGEAPLSVEEAEPLQAYF